MPRLPGIARAARTCALLVLSVNGCPSRPTYHEAIPSPSARENDRAPAPSATTSTIAAVAADASSGPPESAFCRRIREESERVIPSHTEPADTCKPPELLGSCIGGPSSSWALALEEASYAVDPRDGLRWLSVRWSLVHEGAPEARVHPRAPEATPEHTAPDTTTDAMNLRHNCSYDLVSVPPPDLFDFDGDGVPEVVLHIESWMNEGGTWHHGRVWTFKNGRIVPYEPARAFSVLYVSDVDKDGRPDLWTHGPYSAAAESAGSGFTYPMTGPKLVAHSLPGGSFSMDDEVASAAARESCSEATGALLGPSGDEQFEVAARVVCARLAGEAAAAVTSRIDRECGGRAALHSPCISAPIWKQFARATPPLRLRRASPQ